MELPRNSQKSIDRPKVCLEVNCAAFLIPVKLGCNQSFETAKDKILNCVKGCLMVNRYALYFFKKIFQSVCHCRFRILFDFYSATFFWSLFRKCTDHQNTCRLNTLLNCDDVVCNFLFLCQEVKCCPVVPEVILFSRFESCCVCNYPFYFFRTVAESLFCSVKRSG